MDDNNSVNYIVLIYFKLQEYYIKCKNAKFLLKTLSIKSLVRLQLSLNFFCLGASFSTPPGAVLFRCIKDRLVAFGCFLFSSLVVFLVYIFQISILNFIYCMINMAYNYLFLSFFNSLTFDEAVVSLSK